MSGCFLRASHRHLLSVEKHFPRRARSAERCTYPNVANLTNQSDESFISLRGVSGTVGEHLHVFFFLFPDTCSTSCMFVSVCISGRDMCVCVCAFAAVFWWNEIQVLASPFLSAGNKNIECPPDPFIERELRPQRNLGQAPLIWRLQYYWPSQPRQYERPFLNHTATPGPEGQRGGTQRGDGGRDNWETILTLFPLPTIPAWITKRNHRFHTSTCLSSWTMSSVLFFLF